jgi:citryl-CoA synthetase large subunit
MKLYEYEAYDTIFKKYGVPIPKYLVVQHQGQNVADFVEQADSVVIKSQVLVGKRGKAGAVKFAKTGEEANEYVKALMETDVYGEKPVNVILQEKANILKELYVSFTYSSKQRRPVFVISLQGGVDIEEQDPSNIFTFDINPLEGLFPYKVREFLLEIGFNDKDVLRQLSEVISNMYHGFWSSEARLIEVNPLVIAEDKKVAGKQKILALDAVVIIDDDARIAPSKIYTARGSMGRPLTKRESEAHLIDRDDHRGKAGSYVELDGNMALMTFGGGGSTITTETVIALGMKPANLTDIGGNPPAEKMNKISKIILSKPGLKAILVCGGTASNTRIDVTLGEGLVSAIEEMIKDGTFPKGLLWFVRRSGPEYQKGLKMLNDCFVKNGIESVIYDSELPLTAAPQKLYELLKEKNML